MARGRVRADGSGGRWRRLLAGGLLALGVGLGSVVVDAGTAWADDGLTMASDATFTYDPAAALVRVTVEVRVRNVTTDTRDGNVVRRLYYTGVSLPVPSVATDVRATADGEPLTVTVTPAGDRVARAEVAFTDDLFAGQARTVTVDYELRGDAPRAEGFVRVNPAYAAFVAYGAGDPGQVSVRVVVPRGVEVETLGDDVTRREEGDTVVYAAEGIVDPDEWYVAVSARNDDALERTDLDIGGRALAVAAWPGDVEWADFVRRNLDAGIPALERLIGRPWPIEDRLAIVETVTPYLRGYAGWFLVRQNRIEVGEDLDDRTLLHELSHAWFNADLFDARWINEGMAEEFSARALGELGRPVPAPEAVDPSSANAVKLDDWSAPDRREDDDDTERWGYNASWSVINRLTAEIGIDAMARVLAAAADDTQAYFPGEPSTATTVDWRRFLDLLTELGGSTTAEGLFRSLVVAPADLPDLDIRAEARARLAAVAAAGEGWEPPVGIRQSLETWSFGAATALADEAEAVLAVRTELAAAAAAAALTPVSVEDDYEAATRGLGPVRADLERQLASVGAITTARARVAEPRSLVERVGLWGRTPAEELAAAVVSFERDDTVAADAAAARAMAMVATADDIGRSRVTRASTATGGGVVVLAAATVIGRRRRRHRRSGVGAPSPDLWATAAPATDAGPDGTDAAVEDLEIGWVVGPADPPPPPDGLGPPGPPDGNLPTDPPGSGGPSALPRPG